MRLCCILYLFLLFSCNINPKKNISQDEDTNYINSLDAVSRVYYNEYIVNDIDMFDDTLYITSAEYSNCRFKSGVGIYEHMLSSLKFDKCTFEGYFALNQISINELNLSNSNIESECEFSETQICKKLLLSNLKLSNKSKLVFNDVSLPEYIDLSNNLMIPYEIDLLTATHGGHNYKTKINLFQSDVSMIRMDYLRFQLCFDSLDNEYNFYGGNMNEAIINVYESLLSNFKIHNQLTSYKLLDIEYQEYLDISFFKWRSKISKLWWNFGYNKEYIFLNMFCIVFLFTIINFFILGYLQDRVYHITNIPNTINSRNNWKKIVLKLWYSLMYTVTIYFMLSFKIEKLKYRNPMILYIFAIHVLGLISMAYVANFIIQK